MKICYKKNIGIDQDHFIYGETADFMDVSHCVDQVSQINAEQITEEEYNAGIASVAAAIEQIAQENIKMQEDFGAILEEYRSNNP